MSSGCINGRGLDAPAEVLSAYFRLGFEPKVAELHLYNPLYFETAPHYVVQAGCHLLVAGITGVCHYYTCLSFLKILFVMYLLGKSGILIHAYSVNSWRPSTYLPFIFVC